jgi:hypothetical protein
MIITLSRVLGVDIIVVSRFAPCNTRFFCIQTVAASMYVPAAKLTVLPGVARSTVVVNVRQALRLDRQLLLSLPVVLT